MSTLETNETPRRVFAKHELVGQLRELGLTKGDIVLVRVDFGKLGRVQRPADRVFTESLLEAVGPAGSIIALTHSPCQFFFKRDPSYIYDPASAPCVTGRFAETIWNWDGAYRSLHPTCSMAALGTQGHALLRNHDHTSTCFAPIKDLIQAGGKMLLIGCSASSPGFSTVHLVYERLGLATHSLLSGLVGCYYRKGLEVRWFHQRDVPGCSLGYHKFYPHYRARGVLRTGPVGAGEAYLIRAADAFAVEREVIALDPRCSLCDDPNCFSCRATKLFNLGDMPGYYLQHAPRLVLRLLGKGRAA